MKILPSLLLLFVLALFSKSSHGQTDSLIFSNGNTMVGEIKSLQNGVVTIKTPYSGAPTLNLTPSMICLLIST